MRLLLWGPHFKDHCLNLCRLPWPNRVLCLCVFADDILWVIPSSLHYPWQCSRKLPGPILGGCALLFLPLLLFCTSDKAGTLLSLICQGNSESNTDSALSPCQMGPILIWWFAACPHQDPGWSQGLQGGGKMRGSVRLWQKNDSEVDSTDAFVFCPPLEHRFLKCQSRTLFVFCAAYNRFVHKRCLFLNEWNEKQQCVQLVIWF